MASCEDDQTKQCELMANICYSSISILKSLNPTSNKIILFTAFSTWEKQKPCLNTGLVNLKFPFYFYQISRNTVYHCKLQ